MSINPLNDISRVYLEHIASVNEAAKPDYLDFDGDGNKKETMKKALKDKKKVEEAAKVNDGNLANNYPPYDKVTRGDVIAGRLGKDQMGGKKKVAKEGYSNWRMDLAEVIGKNEDNKKITEKKVNNKIVINPKLDLGEAIENLGGVLLEVSEIEEGYQPISREKENKMYARAGNLARTALSTTGKKKETAQTKSSKIVGAITRQKEKERFDRIGQSPAHNEEFQLDEKTLTAAETKEKERLVKSMKDKAADFEKRYPGRGKEVMYATATKMAKKMAEQAMELQPKTSQPKEKPLDTAVERQKYTNLKMMQQKQQQLQKQKLNLQKQGRLPLESESYEPIIDEARASEKKGAGSPESSLSYPGRTVQKQRGEMGGRHWQSGGEGGSKTERGKKKSDPQSQTQRLRSLAAHPEKSGKYAEMQRKKRGGDIGSRFD